MAEITEKPAGLPSGNTVDPTLLEEELNQAYISFQATGIKLELGDTLTLIVHGKCVEAGDKEAKDGEIRPKRVISVLSVHKPGKRPETDPAQGSIFSIVSDENGTSLAADDDGGDDNAD